MPILRVDIVLNPDETVATSWPADLAAAAGRVLNAAPGTTWVFVHEISRERYAENGPAVANPVMVSVTRSRLPSLDTLDQEALSLTRAVAEVLGRAPENVHVIYEPPAAGRIFFGGRGVSG